MQRVFLTVVFSLVITMGAMAQAKSTTNTGTKFSIGPNVGYGWTTMSNIDSSKFKAAANFGISAVYSAAEHFAIGMDVKYSIEGAKFERDSKTAEIDLHYVRIPLKAIYFFNGYGSKVRPKIYAGPTFGFLSSAKLNNYAGVAEKDVVDAFDGFDLGIQIGAGLNYRLANKTWFNFDLSFMNGLKDAMHQDQFTFRHILNTKTPNDKFVNRSVTLNVGVNFGL